ncbi:CDP-alcohol phosphatidyltransferase family protein [Anaeromyxobacter paludicola]|uniref:CDP-diacylglycerol--glycerol-3-phosphate 3-phosphatidyltransferase n=1 Tax=Anaeromyxobacter paludicola TaxID=2918171 RepID=A0ABM7X6I6_9BACT|nr:CDP-alcohol phosphatidyltransferase family protein [Anaeromyxobacter paludicola]BDG07427.1 putative CDP-diacylglycerol--glycerol-3-phosphate 3-phosphatidyl-transferase 2 [Anaeromyxobacter paludicola]
MGQVLTLANLLTFARILLAPVFLVLYVRGETVRALSAFAAAAATDVLDGLVARALDQRTRLGAFLDPAADKLLAACALVALAARGGLPWWLPALTISRDAAQLLGAGALRLSHHRVPIAPTRIGKYATFALAVTVLLALAAELGAFPRARAAPLVAAFGTLAAECVLVSFAQYFLYFVRSWRLPRAPDPV